MKDGPIILVENDEDDKVVFEEILIDLGYKNKLLWFPETHGVLDYLHKTKDRPFIIICDVNLPKQDGLEFKKEIDTDTYLRKKSIPFVFYSTVTDQRSVNEAYTKMTVQGFFKKAHRYQDMKKDIQLILEYWASCKHPNAA